MDFCFTGNDYSYGLLFNDCAIIKKEPDTDCSRYSKIFRDLLHFSAIEKIRKHLNQRHAIPKPETDNDGYFTPFQDG